MRLWYGVVLGSDQSSSSPSAGLRVARNAILLAGFLYGPRITLTVPLNSEVVALLSGGTCPRYSLRLWVDDHTALHAHQDRRAPHANLHAPPNCTRRRVVLNHE